MRYKSIILILIIIFMNRVEKLRGVPSNPSIVIINNYGLYVEKRLPDGTLDTAKPYMIRGVGWSPAGIGTGGGQVASYYAIDLPMMSDMYANTIRNWSSFPQDADGIAALDMCYNKGIMVIMTVDEQNYTSAVNYFKNHPAILMWALGNEWNYNKFYGRYSTINDCINAINSAAAGIKSLDPNHPVATIYGDLPDSSVLSSCTGPDIWGLNVYRGTSFGNLFNDWKSRSSKPMFISEYGADAYNNNISGEDVDSQAYGVNILWNEIANNLSKDDIVNKVCIGGCIFEWNDEWWKSGNYSSHDTGGFNISVYPDNFANEEWWGIVDINRNKRKVFYTMQSNWKSMADLEVSISIDKSSPISIGNVNVTITTYFTNTAVNPKLFWVDPDKTTNYLSLTGPDTENNFKSIFTVDNNYVNGDYQLVFTCETNGKEINGNYYFAVDTISPNNPKVSSITYDSYSRGIKIKWEASSDNYSGVDKYKIYRSIESNNFVYLDETTKVEYIDTSVQDGQKYYYRITSVDKAGNESGFSDIVSFRVVTSSKLVVYPSIINFFENKLNIELSLSQDTVVNIGIYDINGNLINTLISDKESSQGIISKEWNGYDEFNNIVDRGIYYCVVNISGEDTIIKKFVVENIK